MNFTLNAGQGGFLLVLFFLWGLFVTIFWMVVGWRAIRAHETLAFANRQLADEVHRWRRAAEQKPPSTGPGAAASAAEETRITDMLVERERNA